MLLIVLPWMFWSISAYCLSTRTAKKMHRFVTVFIYDHIVLEQFPTIYGRVEQVLVFMYISLAFSFLRLALMHKSPAELALALTVPGLFAYAAGLVLGMPVYRVAEWRQQLDKGLQAWFMAEAHGRNIRDTAEWLAFQGLDIPFVMEAFKGVDPGSLQELSVNVFATSLDDFLQSVRDGLKELLKHQPSNSKLQLPEAVLKVLAMWGYQWCPRELNSFPPSTRIHLFAHEKRPSDIYDPTLPFQVDVYDDDVKHRHPYTLMELLIDQLTNVFLRQNDFSKDTLAARARNEEIQTDVPAVAEVLFNVLMLESPVKKVKVLWLTRQGVVSVLMLGNASRS
jgi:hypothetical protein